MFWVSWFTKLAELKQFKASCIRARDVCHALRSEETQSFGEGTLCPKLELLDLEFWDGVQEGLEVVTELVKAR